MLYSFLPPVADRPSPIGRLLRQIAFPIERHVPEALTRLLQQVGERRRP